MDGGGAEADHGHGIWWTCSLGYLGGTHGRRDGKRTITHLDVRPRIAQEHFSGLLVDVGESIVDVRQKIMRDTRRRILSSIDSPSPSAATLENARIGLPIDLYSSAESTVSLVRIDPQSTQHSV